MDPFDTLGVVLDVAFVICVLIGFGYILHGWRAPRTDRRRPYADTE